MQSCRVKGFGCGVWKEGILKQRPFVGLLVNVDLANQGVPGIAQASVPARASDAPPQLTTSSLTQCVARAVGTIALVSVVGAANTATNWTWRLWYFATKYS
jgi:hypothetical protein